MSDRIRCDVCGQFIAYDDIDSGKAIHVMKTPDSDLSYETWESLCWYHTQVDRAEERL